MEGNRDHDLSKLDECNIDNEVTGKEIAIQTNPHEIERNRGQLPLRKRFVPVRFSDYGIFADNAKEEDESVDVLEDSDFIPTETFVKQTSHNKDDKQKRARGRPRKNKDHPNVSEAGSNEGDGHESIKKNPITKVSNGFKCGVCGKIFTLRGNAKTHLITHTDDKPFPCDFKDCGKFLRTKESLRRHKLSHLGVKTFECSECNKKFSCNLSLQEHMSRHTGQKPLTCDICGAKFRQIAVLKRHLTTHSSKKPFACEVCGKKFSLQVYVRSHMKTHTGERPFPCDMCNKCFAHASDLNRHKIIHSGKKPYQCSMCPMRYSDPSSRRRHEREHESKPQYVCHLCKQQFPRAGQLRVHLVKEHTTATSTLDQHNVVPFPIKIENDDHQNGKLSPLSWESSLENTNNNSTRVVNLQPAMVQAAISMTSDSVSGIGLGQNVSTVQIVLDSATAGQVNSGKEISQAPLHGDLHNVQSSNVQTVVMELPQNTENFAGQPSNGATYKVINTVNQVFEIQVEKEPSQVPFQVQDLSNEMKINVSDLKMSDGSLVAFIQDGDTLTVMEQTEASHQPNSNNDNNIDIMVHRNGDESNTVGSSVGETLECKKTTFPESEPNIDKVAQHDSITIPLEQQENIVLANEEQENVHNPSTSDMSQPDRMSETYPVHENQISSVELSQDTPSHFVDISDKNNLLDDANSNSKVIPVSSASICSCFIENPDLNSQDYYNWLSSFSEECKHFAMPLSKEVFTKISQVQKTLMDFMATPNGVITDKSNFKILMGITQDLSRITSSHLSFMYSNLNT